MPIKVFKLTYYGKNNKRKKRITITPGISVVRENSPGSAPKPRNYYLQSAKGGSTPRESLGRYTETLKAAPSVYTVAEIDKKIDALNKRLKSNREQCDKDITKSLKSIQSEIKKLKDAMMNDPLFRETIKQEILADLKKLEE